MHIYTYSYVTHRQLTHGTFDRTTQSGRVAETWRGGVEEVRKKLGALTTNMVYRGGKALTRVWVCICLWLCIKSVCIFSAYNICILVVMYTDILTHPIRCVYIYTDTI